jgi:outer membrane protein
MAHLLARTAPLAILAMGCLAAAQDTAPEPPTLDLAGALTLAKKNNGTVRAAQENLRAAQASVKGARAAFFPGLQGSYVRAQTQLTGHDNLNFSGQPASEDFQPSQSALLTLNYTVFDNGRRGVNLRQFELSAIQTEANALQSLRQVLFDVHSRYFAELRAQELLRVQDAQLKRANEILEQTKVRVQLGDAARKDILQAQADALNARASFLQARNQVETTRNDLVAVIGWSESEFPHLAPIEQAPDVKVAEISRDLIVTQGLNRRADLAATRASLAAADQTVRLAKLDAGPQFSTALQYQKSLGDNYVDTTKLQFNLSGPLYDAGLTRSAVLRAESNRNAARANLTQTTRVARAEIESTLYALQQDADRYQVAVAALAAAQENYNAASEAQRLGAGTLIDVLTAQVSLVTAEQNSVQARYDLMTDQVRLRLVTGESLPGE